MSGVEAWSAFRFHVLLNVLNGESGLCAGHSSPPLQAWQPPTMAAWILFYAESHHGTSLGYPTSSDEEKNILKKTF